MAVLQFVLGMLQMAGAVASAVLLLATGVSVWSIGGAAVTTTVTVISVLLFGRRRPRAANTRTPRAAARLDPPR